MKTQSIIYGIIGLFIGVLLTSFVMANQNKQAPINSNTVMPHETKSGMEMSMQDMINSLKGETGDDFDKAFISGMIEHHQGAIDMAQAAKTDAKHEEIKNMADDIITAQTNEIQMMQAWQKEWGYTH